VYSTIRPKMGYCELCSQSKGKQPLTKKLCSVHYWQSIKMKSVNKFAEKEEQEDDLQDLIKDADVVYSKWLRMSGADKEGTVSCYTCDLNMRWQNAQCGHYVKRGNLFLRWDPRNTRIQGECCNIHKGGNYLEFTKRLEFEHPGITSILMEEGHLVYKPSRDEIRAVITEYTLKIRKLNL
jgi:hypothetical protein